MELAGDLKDGAALTCLLPHILSPVMPGLDRDQQSLQAGCFTEEARENM
jgi:hypothetical protein